MSLVTHRQIEQGTDEWLQQRCGIVTASVVDQLVTAKRPTGIVADCPECDADPHEPCVSLSKRDGTPIKTMHPNRIPPDAAPKILETAYNETSQKLTAHLAAERITGYVEPAFTSRDMERGQLDEPLARQVYADHYAPVEEVGLIVRDDWGFPIGFSPDGLVGDDGAIEIKSRLQKKQLATILAGEVPAENMAQCQTALLVSGRSWIDYVSYCGGMPLFVKRVFPDERWHTAIVAAVAALEENAAAMIANFHHATVNSPPTERIDHYADMDLVI